MTLKILVCSLLTLSAANAVAGNHYIYKDKGSQVVLTNINPNGKSNKFSKKVRVNYYSDSYSVLKKAERAKYLAMADEGVSHSTDAKKAERDIAERAKYLAMADE